MLPLGLLLKVCSTKLRLLNDYDDGDFTELPNVALASNENMTSHNMDLPTRVIIH